MNITSARWLRWINKKNVYLLILLLAVARYSASAILDYSFPESLLLLFIPLCLIIFLLYDMRWGIGIWFFTAALGNFLEIDLPGIPPLRPAHLGLLLLLTVWFFKSYKEIPLAIGRFLSTGKSRILLVLLGWITLSIVMGRVNGVTQQSIEYQFNAWLGVVLAILLALLVSDHLDESFLRAMIWIIVCIGTVIQAATLATAMQKGVELLEYKVYSMEFSYSVWLACPSPLLLALLFFRDQKWGGKILFSIAIVLSLVNTLWLILNGHRSSALWLVGILGFVLLFTRPRLLLVLVLLVVLPFIALNFSAVNSWINEQTVRLYTRHQIAIYGPGARIALAKDAIEIIKRQPLWGTGSDLYNLHTNVLLAAGNNIVNPAPSAHNSWLQVGVDHGIPAAVLLIVFCGYVFKDAFLLFCSSNNRLFKIFALFFISDFGARMLGSFISSGHVLPVFTGALHHESAFLASHLLSFWFYYGLLIGIENKKIRYNSAVVNSGARR